MLLSSGLRLVSATCLIVGAVFTGCQGNQFLPDTVPPYDIVEVVPGVYAAIANPGGSAGANAGIFHMDPPAIVFDTGLTPEAGLQLKSFAEEISGGNVMFVVSSHFHDDHIGGNQVFDAATFISTTATQQHALAAGEGRSSDSVQKAQALLNEIVGKLESETDPKARRELMTVAGDMQGIVTSDNDFFRIAPTVVWDSRINFTGNLRQIKLIPTGKGHADGDVSVWLEADSVLFAGDLVTTDRHPTMEDGDPDGWVAALDTLLTLEFDVVVPGHGPLGDRQSIIRMKDYLEMVETAAAQVAAGAQIDAIPVDSAFVDWMFDAQFRSNIRFVMAYRAQEE